MPASPLTPRRVFLLAMVPGVLLASEFARAEIATVETTDGDAWQIVIEPVRQLSRVDTPTPLPPTPAEPQDIPAPPLAIAQEDAPATPVVEAEADDTGIAITPRSTTAGTEARRYRDTYDAIPFSRTEFLANPSYRHNATMELLLGQLRPVTINQSAAPASSCAGGMCDAGQPPLSSVPYPNSFGYLWNTYEYPWAQFDFWQYRAPAFRYFLPYGIAPSLLTY